MNAFSAAVDRWPTVSFRHGSSIPGLGDGFDFPGIVETLPNTVCGVATHRFRSNGEMLLCEIELNVNHARMGCGTWASTVTHETGHCLGYIGHSSDEGLMDAVADESQVSITPGVRKFIALLYSLPPGTAVKPSGKTSAFRRNQKSFQYDPDGKKIYTIVQRLKTNGDTEVLFLE